MSLTKTACPGYAPVEVAIDWPNWSETRRQNWINLNPPGTKNFTKTESDASAEAPKKNYAKSETGRIAEVYEDKPVTEWDRDVDFKGKVVPAKRIRYAILELIEKSQWYAENMSNGFVERNLERILGDSTPGWEPPEADPLFETVEKTDSDGNKYKATNIRHPKNDAERKKIREKFGVTTKTIPFLAKADCPTCKGRGYYSVSSYPGDPVYSRLEEFVNCPCSYE